MLYVTVGSPQEAREMARILVLERLTACVNVIDKAASIYLWDEELQEDSESILIIKTTLDRRDTAMARIQHLHSYDTPCVVAYDISAGLPDYLAWLASETKDD